MTLNYSDGKKKTYITLRRRMPAREKRERRMMDLYRKRGLERKMAADIAEAALRFSWGERSEGEYIVRMQRK